MELRDRVTTRWIEDSARKTWAVCGHTRAGTRGGSCTRNAHPFEYGRVIGAHNGTIPDAPKEYPVDTEWAIDLLSKNDPGAYQKALGEVSGWYVLTWLDQREKAIYLLNWEGTLNITLHQGVYYYSSEADHLRTAIGKETKIAKVEQGNVLRFHWDKGVKVQNMPAFTGKPRYARTQTDYTNYNRSRSHSNAYYDDGANYEQPRLLGPVTARDKVSVVDPKLPSGYIMKFPAGVWYAQLLNGFWRQLLPQRQLNEKYPSNKVGDYHWMRPGEVRAKLTPISAATPETTLPPGLKAPPSLVEETEALKAISGSAQNAEKKSNQGTGSAAFPTEAEQEKADLEEMKAEMDKALNPIDAKTKIQQDRHDYLTEEVHLTHEEALRVMAAEGFFQNN